MPKRSLTRDEERQAARDLIRQGVAPTRENIAEQAAVSGKGKEQAGRKAAQDLGVGGPTSEIARRKQREMDEARRKGPPADMLRKFREKNR
jgi:hypothetical protein